MLNTTLIFLRHADTQKDPNLNAALWGLSEMGQQQAEKTAHLPIFDNVDIILTSDEQKTYLTVLPIAQKLGKETVAYAFFNEVKRGDKFLSKDEFEQEKILQLMDLNYHAFGGESGYEALARFKQGVDFAISNNRDKTILIVTHGTILNIYFADMLNQYDKLSDRWNQTPFCAIGIVENGKITKDIIGAV